MTAVEDAQAEHAARRRLEEENASAMRQIAALSLIASGSCERSTLGPGSCFAPGSGRSATAMYGGDLACAPCVALWGLGRIKDATHNQAGEPS